MFTGKNPVLGLLKPSESLAAFLISFARLRKPFNLRNNLVMFPLDKPEEQSCHDVVASRAATD